ncbi:MAG: hypothetical protein WC876_00440 [Candidatus Thermoplasmatota archaeon]|jgi:hypothetical protein
MDLSPLAPTVWTTGVLGSGGFLLYAVGGVLDHTDLLLLVMGAGPVAAFGLVAFGWTSKNGLA